MNAQLCCQTSFATTSDDKVARTGNITCPFNESEFRSCKLDTWNIEQDQTKIWNYTNHPNIEVCFGYSMNPKANDQRKHFQKGMLLKRYECETKPCDGKKPCIR